MNITLTTMPVRNSNYAEPRLPQFRVTVNARCGRACFFCRPSGEAVATAAGTELKVDDLIAVAKVVRAAGITSIKLTGGDPALYDPLEDAVLRLPADLFRHGRLVLERRGFRSLARGALRRAHRHRAQAHHAGQGQSRANRHDCEALRDCVEGG